MNQISMIKQFEQFVANAPDEPALVSKECILSYGELNTRANRLAHLIHYHYKKRYSNEMVSEVLIAFCLPKGLDAYILILAILKAGGAYLALDPANPKERLQWILQDSRAQLFITQSDMGYEADIFLDKQNTLKLLENQPTHNVLQETSLQNLAYVNYTSGSTGQPKGVMIEQQSIVRLVIETNYIHINNSDRIAALSNLSFDGCTFEIWGAWLNGAALIVPPKDVLDSMISFESYLTEQRVMIAFLTTALFHLVASENPSIFKNLRYLLFGGDLTHLEKIKSVFNCKAGKPQHLLHVYGPTENTTFSTAYEVKETINQFEFLPMGHFITGSSGHVLKETLEPCKIGEIGELYLGGLGLARNYINNAEKDEERFIYSLSHESRLYRTGDLVRLTENGEMMFVGRTDFQVKIRGFRVELGEVEVALNHHPHIQDAAIIVQGESSEQKHLVAYCVIQKNEKELVKNTTVNYWTHVYDELYDLPKNNQKLIDFSGWNSSFTQEMIAEEGMLEWRNKTVERIRQLNPKRILEIGCGSGLLLFPLLDYCESYYGIDISKTITDRLNNLVEENGYTHVKLEQCAAHDIERLCIAPGEIDTIVMNSVSMHFPHVDYLTEVLVAASKKIKRGKIFVGDVRDYRLLTLFHWLIVRFQNPNLTPEEALRLSQYTENNEKALLTSPEYFLNLSSHLPNLNYVEVMPKRGTALHEMNYFRFDVILHFDDEQKTPSHIVWSQAQEISDLREHLRLSHDPVIGINHYLNERIYSDYSDLLSIQLKKDRNGLQVEIFSLETLHQLASEEGFNLHVYCAIGDRMAPAYYQLIFAKKEINFVPTNAIHGESHDTINANIPEILSAQANVFSFEKIRDDIKKILPDYMCPTDYVQLDALPLTLNGKVDRKALRSFKLQSNDVQPCIDSIQYQLILIWESIFSQTYLGTNTNFLSLGGNSILAIQIIYRINETFKTEYPVAWIFTHQTIGEQAECLRQQSALFGRYNPIIHFNASALTSHFYMVHPGLIGAECYAELANLLDRRISFSGVDSFNLYNDPMKSSITALASYYVQMILKNNTPKAVYLGGWSMGGLIAFEMALALQKRGVQVIKLFLIESDPPNYQNKLIENHQSVDPSKLNNTADYIQEYLRKLPDSILGRVLNNLNHDLRLCVDYHPTGVFVGEALIFEADHWSEDDLIGERANLMEAWKPYIEKIKVITVPGNHLSIMDHPNIKFVSERISQEILSGVLHG